MAPDPRFLALAVEAVIRAGDMQLARFRTDVGVRKKGAIDLVTEVDVAVERMFRDLVAARFPGHDVVAEELESTLTGSRYRWIFDPLDGTTNYAHGIPLFCASLALAIDGVVEVGAVYDPSHRELFTAERGVGAWLNGQPLAVSQTTSLVDAMLVTGFPYNVHQTIEELVAVFARFIASARAVRRLGSAAIDLCWVAAGRTDGFWEQRLKPWDTAAASLVLTEAGGRVTGMDGSAWAPNDGHILASNGHLHDQMLAVVAAGGRP
ncbi:MAG: inositol monophosphatase family protein [Vicinamibacterales bacterium]